MQEVEQQLLFCELRECFAEGDPHIFFSAAIRIYYLEHLAHLLLIHFPLPQFGIGLGHYFAEGKLFQALRVNLSNIAAVAHLEQGLVIHPAHIIFASICLLAHMAAVLIRLLLHVVLGVLLGGEIYQTPMLKKSMNADN